MPDENGMTGKYTATIVWHGGLCDEKSFDTWEPAALYTIHLINKGFVRYVYVMDQSISTPIFEWHWCGPDNMIHHPDITPNIKITS